MDYKEILNDKIVKSPNGWRSWLSGQKEILIELNKEPSFLSITEKVYWYLNDLTDFPKCTVCGKTVTRFKGVSKGGYVEHCGCSCAQKDEKTREKLNKTNLLRWGVKNPAQTAEIQKKMKATCKNRYGAENIFGSEIGKQKIKNTNLKKFGCENPQQNEQIKNKTKETLIQRYGITCGFHNNKNFHKSKGEQELFDFIKFFKNDARHGDRKQIWPMEIDVYIPSLNIGFEYDGDYWHSLPDMIQRDKEKDLACKNKGIKLFRVKEHDWIKNNENEKNRIMEIING